MCLFTLLFHLLAYEQEMQEYFLIVGMTELLDREKRGVLPKVSNEGMKLV
jgi:hypothetical protein